MSKTVEFFFDFGSPTTYLAWTQLPGICAKVGATLVYRPMLLGAVFQATGNVSPAMIPAKIPFMTLDLARFARRYNVPLRLNPHFPFDTLTLMRCATAVQVQEPARLAPFLDAIFTAIWAEGLNLSDPMVAGSIISAAGFDAQKILEQSSQQVIKSSLRETTEEAIQRGAFGAPTMFVGNEMFFGQDRLDFLVEELKR